MREGIHEMSDYVTPAVQRLYAWSSCQVPLSNLPDTTFFLPSSHDEDKEDEDDWSPSRPILHPL